MYNRSATSNERTACFFCDWWWVFLLGIFLLLGLVLTRFWWLPLLGLTSAPSIPPVAVAPVVTTAPVTTELPANVSTTATTPIDQPVAIASEAPINPPTTLTGNLIGEPLPQFSLKSTSGDQLTNANLQGSPSMIVFFASWCPFCQAQADAVKKISQQYAANGLKVIGVDLAYSDEPEKVQEYISRYAWDFPVLLDENGDFMGAIGQDSVPLTLFIDRNGVIRNSATTALSEQKMQELINELLNY
jgi:cytochrome c biogenesis protein CcmG, thiol:disulfide interchange protein DsbE